METMDSIVQTLHSNPYLMGALVFVFGVCVGSFLNVLALRTLAEKSILYPPSACPQCNHALSILDLVPVLSYLFLKGKCRYCQNPISWQYPAVELLTGLAFVAVVFYNPPPTGGAIPYPGDASGSFGWWPIDRAAKLVFVCTLITICITDFREKLIPHEITYPSMLLGILYRHTQCDDFIPTLAGIGISYILFDFLAFYGLKLYLWMHGDPTQADGTAHHVVATDRDMDLSSPPHLVALSEESDDELDEIFGIETKKEGQVEEEFEVMGGGDAVLSAVIAAWLGLEKLGAALLIGFLVGTIMGAVYLTIEMQRHNLLKDCLKPSLIGAAALTLFVEALLYALASLTNGTDGSAQTFLAMPWWQLGLAAIVCGGMLGVISVGSKVSKPFPFGPPLAIGAVAAMFLDRVATMLNGGA